MADAYMTRMQEVLASRDTLLRQASSAIVPTIEILQGIAMEMIALSRDQCPTSAGEAEDEAAFRDFLTQLFRHLTHRKEAAYVQARALYSQWCRLQASLASAPRWWRWRLPFALRRQYVLRSLRRLVGAEEATAVLLRGEDRRWLHGTL